MLIYNITYNVDDTIHEEWYEWIKNHIPKILSTGKFLEAKFSKVIIEEEMGGQTYSLQLKVESKVTLDKYYTENAEQLRQLGLVKFADKVLTFRTELEIIDEYRVNFN
jgi:hypothetical protein